MSSKVPEDSQESIPLPQRLLESPFLLLAAGMFFMVVFYTVWGWIEIAFMPKSPLP